VKTQVWIAVSMYVMVAIVRKELHLDRSLGEILQILSLSLFEETPLNQAFSRQIVTLPEPSCRNQLPLFDL